jgi:hypothetical protein
MENEVFDLLRKLVTFAKNRDVVNFKKTRRRLILLKNKHPEVQKFINKVLT